MKEKKHNTRCAIIEWKEEEQVLADRLLALMNKEEPDYHYSLFDCMALVSLSDREDYEDFKEWYKEAKKSIRL